MNESIAKFAEKAEETWPQIQSYKDLPAGCYDETIKYYEWLMEHGLDVGLGISHLNETEQLVFVYNTLFANKPKNSV